MRQEVSQKMVSHFVSTVTLLLVCSYVLSAPVEVKNEVQNVRKQKSFPFYDYYQPEELDYNYDINQEDFVSEDVEENDLSSRTIPTRKRYNSRPQLNSPIYYIRMPPQPYMFVPNIGYVSQPPAHPLNQFLNLPVSFIANGKPTNIYQWNGAYEQFPAPVPQPPRLPPVTTPKPKPIKTDSTIHRLKGQFNFNGKPNDIYVLQDSYNSLYGDALQNFYP